MLPGHYILFGLIGFWIVLNRMAKVEKPKISPPTTTSLKPCNEEEYINEWRSKELLQNPKHN